MKTYRAIIASICTAIACLLCSAAHAIPVMDVHLEDLMAQASDVKKSLNLNPNQHLLWQQTESKTRAIMSERQRRREQLQAYLKKGLDNPRTELRDLAKQLDAESDASQQENKQLRELWLTVNDALDDAQRQTILVLLADQLQRIADDGHECKPGEPARTRSGMGRQKPGGMNNPMPQ
jgi:hypothetical protein